MSRSLGSQIPPELKSALTSPRPSPVAVPLVTLDDAGFPHLAMLSYYEFVYQDGELFCFVYSSSRTTRFLSESGRCTLLFVEPQFVYYLKGQIRRVQEIDSLILFRIAPREVLEDFPSRQEGHAELRSGIVFEIPAEDIERRLKLREEVAEGIRRRARRRNEPG